MPNRAILVEADQGQSGSTIRHLLTEEWGFCCQNLNWGVFDLDTIRRSVPDLIVLVASCTDEQLPTFRRLIADPIDVPVLSVLPCQADSELVRMASEAADDFLLWPTREEELRQRMLRILGSRPSHIESVTERLTVDLNLAPIVGKDPVFVRIMEQLPKIAGSDVSVLIDGETGTGKELYARAVHFLSTCRDGPFIPVDCGAIPDHLFENEFFGHSRGAFTDARSEQKGLAALAAGGTLFFDEVDTLSPLNQVKLLRFLQERTFRPLGGQSFSRADVRVIAATNTNLELGVKKGEFRSDLYFRLNVLRVSLPPLRKRRLDIPLLAIDHLRSLTARPPTLSASAMHVLMSHDWPGNVRELFNVVHRAYIRSEGRQIQARHISVSRFDDLRSSCQDNFNEARAMVIQSFERQYLIEILARNNGNITRAAREAGKERRAFGRLVKKYGIDPRNI